MGILFDKRCVRREEHGGQVRYRPRCQDYLGNTYTTDYWVEWADEGAGMHGDPGPGYLSSEEILERQRSI